MKIETVCKGIETKKDHEKDILETRNDRTLGNWI